MKIPEEEVRKRMQKLHNYEKILYPQLKERCDRVRAELKEAKAENARLREENNKQLEKIMLQIEELQILKFGKKRGNKKTKPALVPETEEGKDVVAKEAKVSKEKRSSESYQRATPKPEEVTDYLQLSLEVCPECGEALVDKKEHTHYREDLKDVEELIKAAKKIVETKIESGRCPLCDKRQFAMKVPSHKVIIGENVRRMVVYQTVIQGLSYEEVQKSMKCLHGIALSSGQVSNILEGESRLLTPYYNHLIIELDTESKEIGAHYDETSWKTKSMGKEVSNGNYCWIKIGIESQKRLIWFGCSRGKDVAEQLRGDKERSKGITDDYPAYKNCFESHGLCWAHPHRKFRDLAESGNLSGRSKRVCQEVHKGFAKAYKKAENIRKKLLAGELSEEEKMKERKDLEKLFDVLFEPTSNDPQKLITLRKTLKERKDRYFTFFEFPWLPLDNNKAERAIKRVVIKRKKSFGCRSQEGANVLSILYSVIFSLVETYPEENFFSLYKKVVDFDESRDPL